jgi:RNA polymerase sigma factor (TIGR02999 family)
LGSASDKDVTGLLRSWSLGDASALERLVPLVYRDLHERARRLMRRERAGPSLQATALIHEAYLRLVGSKPVDVRSRGHFFALSSRLMRQILVDRARKRGYLKRGGGLIPVTFDEALTFHTRGPDLVRLDEALQSLAATDERKSRVVELRFFGGLSVEETAGVLDVSPQTVLRDWRLAKAWLLREMKRAGRNGQ